MSEKNSMRYNLSTKTTQNPLPPGGGPGWGSFPPWGRAGVGFFSPAGREGAGGWVLKVINNRFTFYPFGGLSIKYLLQILCS